MNQNLENAAKKNTATKIGIDIATAFKRVVHKTAETAGEMIGNKIADKISSVVKRKSKEYERQEIYIPPEKKQQQKNLRLF